MVPWTLHSGSLDQLKDLSGLEGWGTHFRITCFSCSVSDRLEDEEKLPPPLVPLYTAMAAAADEVKYGGGGGPGGRGGGGAIGGGGGGSMAVAATVTSFRSDVVAAEAAATAEKRLSAADSRCLVSLWQSTSVSSFSRVRARLASRSSRSCCLRSASCSPRASDVASSWFSRSSSSVRRRPCRISSSWASLAAQEK